MNEDKQSEMLADHHADLIHEHQLENCLHEEWQVQAIEDLVFTEIGVRSYMGCGISCSFCGKSNSIHISLKVIVDILNDAFYPTDYGTPTKMYELEGEWG